MFEFSEEIVCAAKDITSLELYTVIVAVNFLAPHFAYGNLVSCDNEAAGIASCNFVYTNCASRIPFMISN